MLRFFDPAGDERRALGHQRLAEQGRAELVRLADRGLALRRGLGSPHEQRGPCFGRPRGELLERVARRRIGVDPARPCHQLVRLALGGFGLVRQAFLLRFRRVDPAFRRMEQVTCTGFLAAFFGLVSVLAAEHRFVLRVARLYVAHGLGPRLLDCSLFLRKPRQPFAHCDGLRADLLHLVDQLVEPRERCA